MDRMSWAFHFETEYARIVSLAETDAEEITMTQRYYPSGLPVQDPPPMNWHDYSCAEYWPDYDWRWVMLWRMTPAGTPAEVDDVKQYGFTEDGADRADEDAMMDKGIALAQKQFPGAIVAYRNRSYARLVMPMENQWEAEPVAFVTRDEGYRRTLKKQRDS